MLLRFTFIKKYPINEQDSENNFILVKLIKYLCDLHINYGEF